MAEIRCPHCGEVFQVDESDYAKIVRQVRDREFERQVGVQRAQLEEAQQKTLEAERAKAASESAALAAKLEAEVAALKAQVSQAKDAANLARAEERERMTRQVVERDRRIAELEAKSEAQTKAFDAEKGLAVSNATLELDRKLAARDQTIRDRDDEIERLREQRARLNTKMVGESLEQHCENEFNKLRATAFQGVDFHKDTENAVGDDGRATKGDYIYREVTDDGVELLSIMFEMKNEEEGASHHKRNEDHFKKLDADRRKKNCEYAVLVSTLEPESELYNQGIVDMSWQYPKMYVIRPQFFIPMITVLRNAARNSLDARRELAEARRQDIDVTNFEEKLETFKSQFGRNVDLASKKFDAAIAEIDKTIDTLNKVRANLVATEDYLGKANKRADDLTIRKLTYKNPTMRALLQQDASEHSDEG